MTAPLDVDPLLRRLERRALVFCVLAALAALAARRGDPAVALGILGGGVLIGLSYWAIRSSIDGLMALALGARGVAGGAEGAPVPDARARQRQAARHVLRFTTRYLLLGGLAYVMLVRLSLHPIGLVIGVSSIVVAAAIEAAQGLRPRGDRVTR